jgi:hypothetical protein
VVFLSFKQKESYIETMDRFSIAQSDSARLDIHPGIYPGFCFLPLYLTPSFDQEESFSFNFKMVGSVLSFLSPV